MAVQPVPFVGDSIAPIFNPDNSFLFEVNENNYYGTGGAISGFDANYATISGFDFSFGDKVDLFGFDFFNNFIDYKFQDYSYGTVDANQNSIPDTGIYLPGSQDLIAVVLDTTSPDFIPSLDII